MEEQDEIEIGDYKRSIDMSTAFFMQYPQITKQRYYRVYVLADPDDLKEFKKAFVNADELLEKFNNEKIVAIFDSKRYIDVLISVKLGNEGEYPELWRIKCW